MQRHRRLGRTSRSIGRRARLRLESLEPRQLLDASLVISELMAANTGSLLDGDGQPSDWIEIHNAGDALGDLAGWYLTDDANQLTRWQFPAGQPLATQLDPGEYLTVFASGQPTPNYVDAGGQLHTTFRLATGGEYLALVRPDGTTIAHQFAPEYPEQFADVSYGVDSQTSIDVPLIAPGDGVRALVPTTANGGDTLGTTWTATAFADTGWIAGQTPVGFDADLPDTSVGVEVPLVNGGFEQLTANGTPTISALLEQQWMHFPTVPLNATANQGTSTLATPIEVDGWTQSGSPTSGAGAYNPPGVAPEGQHVLFINGGTGFDYVSQVVSHALAADSVYELAWTRGDATVNNVQLWAGGTLLAELNGAGAAGGRATLRIVSDDFPAAIGQNLEIRILDTAGQTWYDDFALTQFPEPLDVAVPNHSFELDAAGNPHTGDNKLNLVDVLGWESDNDDVDNMVGVANNALGGSPGSTDGAYRTFQQGGTSFYQVLPQAIAPGETYTLTFDGKKDAGAGTEITASLFYVDGGGAHVEIATHTETGLTTNAWRQGISALSFTAAADDPWIGESLGIKFAAGGAWMSVDNVRLRLASTGWTTDLQSEMHTVNASAFLRVPFQVDADAVFDRLELRMQYDDGFVAYLNGTEVARRNFTGAPAWDSSADAARPDADMFTTEAIDLAASLHLLQPGDNVLAIHALNVDAADNDLHVLPELIAGRLVNTNSYFTTPTPGAANGAGVVYPHVLINEMHYDPADRNSPSEFIELFNPSDRAIDLSGFALTGGVDYTFPTATTIDPGAYVVVAQDPLEFDRVFGSGGGSTVAYQIPGGTVGNQDFGGALGMDFVVSETILVTDLGVFDSGADGMNRTITAQLWSRDDGGTPNDPIDDSGVAVLASDTFTAADPGTLVDGSRLKTLAEPLELAPGAYTIVGYGYGAGESNGNNATAGFGTTDGGAGRVSFVNRSRWGNAAGFFPTNADSHVNQYGAGTFRFESATEPTDPIDLFGPWTGALSNDGEQVQLRDAAGDVVDRVDYGVGFPWPLAPNGDGPSMELLSSAVDNDLGGSWRASDGPPTPGEANSVDSANPPPLLRQVDHQPQQPTSGQDVTITAKATDLHGVDEVVLEYQLVDPGQYIGLTDPAYQTDWTAVPMTDDGAGGDAVAGDSVYSAVLPGSVQVHRRLVRYRITAVDTIGAQITAPLPDDPQPNFAYFVYDGIPAWTGADQPGVTNPVTYDADVMNSLPAYHLISDEADVLAAQYNSAYNDRVYRFEAALVYDGVVYDHIRYRVRGQNSTYVVGKNKWKLKFNDGHHLQWRDDFGNLFDKPVDTINIASLAVPWAPPNFGLAGMDEAVSLRLWNLAGVPAANTAAFQLRIIDSELEADPSDQYEGDLWGLYMALEEADGKFLDEHNLPDGNLIKMQSGATRLIHHGAGQPTDLSDVNAFTSSSTGYNKTGPIQPVSWWRDNVNLDGYYSYRSVMEAVNHNDQRDRENSIYFHDPTTGLWSILPWDVDLLYERFDRWGPDGTQSAAPLEQIRKSLQHEEINVEFQSRARELQDLLLNADQAWQLVEEYARRVEPMASVDRAMWDYHPRVAGAHRGAYWSVDEYTYTSGGGSGQVRPALTCPGGAPTCSDFDKMINYVNEFIVVGDFGGDQLAVLHNDPANIPAKPAISYVGAPGFPQNDVALQSGAFVDPQGAGTFAAMQWRVGEVTDPTAPIYDPAAPIEYEIEAVWESGPLATFDDTMTVPGGQLEVGHAYRARVRMQDDTGRWSHWSDPVQFVVTDPLPTDVAAHLRVSEIMYNPPAPTVAEATAGFVDNDDFEYIELINTSDTETLDLENVAFTNGIDYVFPSGVMLSPGERVLVVRNLAAFNERYDTTGMIIAGEYRDPLDDSNKLSNGGETLELLAADGAPVQQFAYNDGNSWPQQADGAGSSLEPVSYQGDYNLAERWYASPQSGGTPGAAAAAVVLQQHIFYDGSTLDTGGSAGNDAAIATDKSALLPGQTATYANVSNFELGINGIMLDVAQPATAALLGPEDFTFRVGNQNDTGPWTPATPPLLAVRPGEGYGGSVRVELTWPTGAPTNIWLEVTMQAASGDTGLLADERFYVGSAIGETGNDPSNLLVTAADVIAIRDNPRGAGNRADVATPHDVNRDRLVNAADRILARNHVTGPLNALRRITPTAPLPPPLEAEGEPVRRLGARTHLLDVEEKGRLEHLPYRSAALPRFSTPIWLGDFRQLQSESSTPLGRRDGHPTSPLPIDAGQLPPAALDHALAELLADAVR